jgi:predicted dehydrogenase
MGGIAMIDESFAIPGPRTEAPLNAPALGWGIMGTGRIAAWFTESLTAHTRQRIVAIGSRSIDTASNFAKRFDRCDAVGSYEALVKHPAVDIVYVSTPHSSHHMYVMLALEAGKHVLVEKPFAINADQAKEMAQTAQQKGLFLMEAMWPRFLPAFDSVRQILSEKVLGEITSVVADLGEYFRPDPKYRLFSPELAGGALLDLGVYLVSLSSLLVGTPSRVSALGQFTSTGVDAQVCAILQNTNGALSTLFTTLAAPTPTGAFVAGTEGTLRLDSPFYAPGRITVTSVDRSIERTREFDVRTHAKGLCYEAAEAARQIAQGSTESPCMPLKESVAILETLDRIREQLVSH